MAGLVARIADDGVVGPGGGAAVTPAWTSVGTTAGTAAASRGARAAHRVTSVVILVKIRRRWTRRGAGLVWRLLGGGLPAPVFGLDGFESGLPELVIPDGGLLLQLSHKTPAEIAGVRQDIPLTDEVDMGGAEVGEEPLLEGGGEVVRLAVGGAFESLTDGELVEDDEVVQGLDGPHQGGAAGLHGPRDVQASVGGTGGVFVGVWLLPGGVFGRHVAALVHPGGSMKGFN